MDRYVGLDAHAQTCTLAVMGPTGKRLTSRVVETNGHALRAAIGEIPGRIHHCLEEGTQSAWLYEILDADQSRGELDGCREGARAAETPQRGAGKTRGLADVLEAQDVDSRKHVRSGSK